MSKNLKNTLTGIGFIASAVTLQSWLQNLRDINSQDVLAEKQDSMKSTLYNILEVVDKSTDLSVK